MASRMSNADHARVSEAVEAAEAGTAGEIVTIVTEASDRYADVALWWSGLAALFAIIAFATFPDFHTGMIDTLAGNWISDWTPARTLEFAATGVVLKFLAMRLLLLWRPLLLLFTPGFVKAARVRGRAIRYFKVGAERRTTGRTGILIYLSMDERRAEIVADKAIHSKVGDDAWGAAMADLIAEVRQGRIADGMIAAIRDVGAILAKHLPREAADKNELPDRLIEL